MQIQITPQDEILEFIDMEISSIESKSSIQIALIQLDKQKAIGISLYKKDGKFTCQMRDIIGDKYTERGRPKSFSSISVKKLYEYIGQTISEILDSNTNPNSSFDESHIGVTFCRYDSNENVVLKKLEEYLINYEYFKTAGIGLIIIPKNQKDKAAYALASLSSMRFYAFDFTNFRTFNTLSSTIKSS